MLTVVFKLKNDRSVANISLVHSFDLTSFISPVAFSALLIY